MKKNRKNESGAVKTDASGKSIDWLEVLLEPSTLLPSVEINTPPDRLMKATTVWWVSSVSIAKTTVKTIQCFRVQHQETLKSKKKIIIESSIESYYGHSAHGLGEAWLYQPQDTRETFERLTQLRLSLEPLLKAHPAHITLMFVGSAESTLSKQVMQDALYALLVNTVKLPHWKSETPKVCEHINIYWVNEKGEPLPSVIEKKLQATMGEILATLLPIVAGQALCQGLTQLPANILHPKSYRKFVQTFAKCHGLVHQEWDKDALKKKGAGAFLAVTQGATPNESAIVRLSFSSNTRTSSKESILPVVVGKGVCFDTGGHQIKSAKYMLGMHRDMNGSAVTMGILYACKKMGFPQMEGYLAIADNAISGEAYRPGDIVQAMDGTTIEVMHTDAEGRMILADTLALVREHHAEKKSSVMVMDFATLTGSMAVAIGTRMSGIFANDHHLESMAIKAGYAVGERLVAFPMPSDYQEGLKSKFADVLQCRMEGEADHIYAALFLSKFIGKLPWVHMDLSASECEGGLGVAMSTVNAFGVRYGIELVQQWTQK